MPDVQITIGGRTFEVFCQEGEEVYLRSAAALLDTEAATLVTQIGRLPEARMLLMSGLMLADKTAGLEERLKQAEENLQALTAQLEAVETAPAQRVEVPVIPAALRENLAELAARAEALADAVEDKTSA
ncbi:cell division protein ZapA [Actibacterium sp.]|uniref:cell division protein ZapA n=1 Tax=Actibacterium sp. TaxID=1872125 RepID=UPI003563A9E0